MRLGSLLYIGERPASAAHFGIVIKLKKVNNERVATVLWDDGLTVDWRYEYFTDTPESQIKMYKYF